MNISLTYIYHESNPRSKCVLFTDSFEEVLKTMWQKGKFPLMRTMVNFSFCHNVFNYIFNIYTFIYSEFRSVCLYVSTRIGKIRNTN